ncbi:MAG: S8 family serine peptidase [Melioribacteraceae bacterium]|nr:S8 family serine peptidase [Melioribacteraceae bacterium]MCF8355818.1 S8 family serine peptidase [Melioribacteraceae bacterium]MCF8395289.1 S8 family serine peptidase [Melioribacteraceae bacterium]MCF8420724.1 S8 family serine peptidase [Melioribacteraceae bacterium]
MIKILLTLLIIIVTASLFVTTLNAQQVIKKGDVYYLPGKVVVKFKNENFSGTIGKVSLSGDMIAKISAYGVTEAERAVQTSKKWESNELDKIAVLTYTSPVDPLYLSKKMNSIKDIEWAEPYYLYETDFIPNDIRYNEQWWLKNIDAQQAWDVTKGSSSVVIAIVDTGIDWDHPDLAANIWRNPGEIDGNGRDDDENGFIDDIRGWDFGGISGTPDNNPMEDRPDHGTLVAGIASEVSDNTIGFASIGFNCKLMAVKTSQDNIRTEVDGDALISHGYNGILYAAENGADIINCSWGGFAYSELAKTVVDQATAMGSLVIAAAGNNGMNEIIYPAAYNNVLSVGVVTQEDILWSASNYGEGLDVLAPGTMISSTWQNDTYKGGSGTSLAAPMTAGLAGLVKTVFPSYTPRQIAEQIRVNAENVDAENPSFIGLIGKGRINAYNAVSNSESKAVRAQYIIFTDSSDGDGVFESGEKVIMDIGFRNFLNATNNLTITLETDDPDVSILSSSFSPGVVGTLVDFNNNYNEFVFTISEDAPTNHEIKLWINYNDGTYDDFELTTLTINPSYTTVAANNISMTFTGSGKLGFNDYPTNEQGDGFSFQSGPNLLFEGAFMYGTGPDTVMDAARSEDQTVQSDDFVESSPFVVASPGEYAAAEGMAVFNDNNGGTRSLGIQTNMRTFSFEEEPLRDFVIIEYTLINKSVKDIKDLYAGLYFDWDVEETDAADNVAAFDIGGGFGYVHNTDDDPIDTYVGAAVISTRNYGFYAIHNNGDDDGFGVYDGFTKEEKWTALSSGLTKVNAGPFDVSTVNSAGPFDISAGDTIRVAFAVGAQENRTELGNAFRQARLKYAEIKPDDDNSEPTVPGVFVLKNNYPNPFNGITNFEFSIEKKSAVQLNVYNILGEKVAVLVNQTLPKDYYFYQFDLSYLSSGVYIYTLQTEKNFAAKKMVLMK